MSHFAVMRPSTFLAALFVSVVPAGAQAQPENSQPPRVVWRDARTKKELFSSADVLAYDAQNSLLLLSSEKTHILATWGDWYKDIEVEDQNGLITKAAFTPDDPLRFSRNFGETVPVYRQGVPIRIMPYGVPDFPLFRNVAVNPDFEKNGRAAERLKADLKPLVPLRELSSAYGSPSDRWYKADEGVSV